ncbi:MAG: HEPN domain-containing protein [Candidatus Brocadiaceae bacterium]|nr:HEPN domain-containing protein [Candidatus Brocadiaceae bacterium]
MKHAYEVEIRREMERSKKSLSAAKRLYEEELFEDAISRSYYAVLHAAKAALLSEHVMVDSHEAVKRLFGMHLVKTGKIDVRLSKILREEQDERFLADYDVSFSPEAERVEKRINDAGYFFEVMNEYLKQKDIDILL